MLAAEFLAILAIILIALMTAGVVGAAFVIAGKSIPKYSGAVDVVVGIIAACWFVYACVRLIFFLPAVVVAEERIGLGRSWELGGGNFWRIFAVMFVVIVPVAIGLAIVQNAVVGPFMPLMQPNAFHPGMTPGEMADVYNGDVQSDAFAAAQHAAVLIVFSLIQELVYLGLGNGAVGKAYLAVTGK